MLYFMSDKTQCTGCGACYNICPIKCISMKKDDEGFLYPVASKQCINCGKCESVCPAVSVQGDTEHLSQEAYCALTKDNKVWQQSASGGAFTEICRAWDNGNSVFCGAVWNGLDVEHRCVQGIDSIEPLRKSKYVASNTKTTFQEIKEYLKNGKRVVFCGTPCQVAGLRHFLGRESENLLLVDLICHGVGSPDVFKACIDNISIQFGGQVCSYEFRAKRNAHQSDYLQKIKKENGKTIYIQNDPYIQLFLSQECLRPSCGKNCKFRSEQRQGDVTIADFKGLLEVFPDLRGSKMNYSSIITNTRKGKNIVSKLKDNMELRQCNIDDIKRHNPLFYRQTWYSEKRDEFFQKFAAHPDQTIERWCKPAEMAKETLKRKLWRYTPTILRKSILKMASQFGEKKH